MESPRYLEPTHWYGFTRPQSKEQRLFLPPDNVLDTPKNFLYIYYWGLRPEIIRKSTVTDDVFNQFGIQLPLDANEVKEAIASIKVAFGLTTKNLAEVLRVERQTIYAWVRGENEPRDENSHRLRSLMILADEWNTFSNLPVKKLLRIEWAGGTTLLGELCCDPLDLDKIRSMMQRGHKLVNEERTPRRSVEQILIDKGLDPAKYRVSDAEFDAATGKAHFPTEDWE